MLRKFSESFTATHATIMFGLALFAPGAFVMAAAVTPVIIQDSAGRQASVSGGQLKVYDQLADYAKDPANAVDVAVRNSGNQCERTQSYRPPSGKSLVITAASGFFEQSTISPYYSGFTLYSGAQCNGRLLTAYDAGVVSPDGSSSAFAPVSVQFGNGIVLPQGQALSLYSVNNQGFTFIHGYLVPASAVPAPGTAEAAWQGEPVTAEMVAAKMARMRGH